jgi:hypothetical protein
MKRALLIGIDTYDHFSPLRGCVNDVNAIEPLLARNETGSPNFDPQKRTSDTGGTTRDELLQAIDALLAPGADVALLYVAGHGAPGVGGDDVTLVTTDGTRPSPGIAMSTILAKVNASPVREVVIILDCCFAGGGGGVPQLGFSGSALRDGTSVLAASRGDQTAAEVPTGRGLFSTYVEGALSGGAADVAGKVTVAGLYSYLDESFGAWDQRPTFKASLDRLHELRLCQPAVPIDELRLINQHFPAANYDFPLDPSYEPDADPRNSEHEQVFATLQKYRAAKLVVPVGNDHMYYAAMESLSCRLTPLGRHYWRLAHENRL